jgi:type VI secretion system secreted protein VgrG
MPSYQQANRLLTMTTPLGPDKLLLIGLVGTESISQLFQIQLDAIATHETKIPFDQLLGKKVTAHIRAPGGDQRHISGICNRVVQGARDATFTYYRLEIVPELWFLTRKTQSRIFQQKSVKEILTTVFEGLAVQYQLNGQYQPRDYCVQYRESDFDFASRLMEEEGIFYFFKHDAGSHTMVVADNPEAHADVPFGSQATYAPLDVTHVIEDRITAWEKTQDLRSMKVTLWDHCFELPHKHLEAEKQIQDSVQVGTVSHKLKVGSPDRLELYDWPGGYAQRFDGVGPGGEDRPSDLQKIFQDNQRTTQIRIQEEATGSLMISGGSRLRQLTAGHRFSLVEHFDANGPYVLTSVSHTARMTSDYRSGQTDDEVAYENSFTGIPASLPFRPQRVTPKPVVHGTQTAVVVGPKGEEIFTDKYGRVKVQFHWDRQGKQDANSSCWVRVGTLWAGTQWGTIHIPRIGQEVIVDFEEGDPDRPIIIGSVYNAKMMPPYKLPDLKTKSVIKSNSTIGGAPDEANELTFEDQKGSEDVYFYAQKDFHRVVKNDDDLQVGDAQTISVENSIKMVAGTSNTQRAPNGYGGNAGLGAAGGVGGLGGLTKGTIEIDAGESITLKVGNSSITITPESISITATSITIGTLVTTTEVAVNATSITIGTVGTTTDVAISADAISMMTVVEMTGEVNIVGNLSVEGEAEIDGVPGPFMPLPV